MEEKLKMIVERMKERDNQGEHILLGGDFNARTGTEGALVEGMEEEKERCSKDKKINKDGRILIKVMEEEGWGIMNGRKQGDEKGEWTYSGGRGESVIDYAIGNIEAWGEVKEIRVEERVESDHHPVSVRIGREKRDEKKRWRRETRKRMDWSEKGRNTFTRKMDELCIEESGIEKMYEELRKAAMEATCWKEKRVGKGDWGRSWWWDEECKLKNREVRRVLRKWRRGEVEGNEYRKMKKEYRKLCEGKKEIGRERLIEEAEAAKSEKDVWKIVNRERRRKKGINEEISMKEWKEHFENLLEGDKRGERWKTEEEGIEMLKGDKIERVEISQVIKGLKKGKAAGKDGLVNEMWIYGGKDRGSDMEDM
ncbi:PREDICTED: uncharacterized protein LOC108779148 [Cyphomyrmex costatus]|uniref:uncharacterized protein LOC108779148 n=1 Tax=Cyphomyrmex costatus TaxID=456900 RepID=UPI0008523783|nr:PREDICTED: uncharacterized protein LOC108779148 [Cyphomyrmex costatus]